MTTEQLFLVCGAVYIAPHIHPAIAHITGFGFLILAACKKLGWI